MAQNITLLGASYEDVPSVLLPKTGGGTAAFDDTTISSNAATSADIASGKLAWVNGSLLTGTGSGGGGGDYPWFGQNTTYVGRILNKTVNLKNDTSFDSWTASTTAGTIKAASTTNDFSQVCDTNNTWWFLARFYVDIALKSSATLKNTVRRFVAYHTHLVYSYPSNNSNLINGTNDTVTYGSLPSRIGLRYYGSTTGSLAFATSLYGPMYVNSAPTYSISGVTFSGKLPAILARCQSTYFATSRKADVDSANTNMVITVDVYKTPVPNSFMSHNVELVRTDMTSGL